MGKREYQRGLQSRGATESSAQNPHAQGKGGSGRTWEESLLKKSKRGARPENSMGGEEERINSKMAREGEYGVHDKRISVRDEEKNARSRHPS